MARRLAHFSDPRLDAQIGELIKKHKELQKDIEQLERRLQKPIGLPDAMPPTEHEHGVADITDFPEAMPPTAHKASHAGGSDAITPADIGAETPSGAQAKVNTHANTKATLAQLGHVNHSVLTTTLNTNWQGSKAPYTKTQTVNGLLATDTPIVDVVMSGDYTADEARIEAWGYVYRITTADDAITLYATEKPTVSLPIQLKVVR